MRLSTVFVLLATVLVNAGIWIGVNKPHHVMESQYPLNGLSYNPYRRYESPLNGYNPPDEVLEADLALLSGKARHLRLYSASGGLERIPALAARYGVEITLSTWVSSDSASNWTEVQNAIDLAQRYDHISRVILGNETQLTEIIPMNTLRAYLAVARERLDTPVSTAEPWDFWVEHPEFAGDVDYVAIHILPYWNEVPIDEAVDYVFDKYQLVKSFFPYKEVIIAETGWPSDGPQRGAAEANQANQAQFIREFVRRAEAEGIDYNVIEAFDQPWKSRLEGRAGEHWGIMDSDRRAKFAMTGPVLEDRNWQYWWASSTAMGALALAFFFFRRPRLSFWAQLFAAVVIQAAATAAVQVARAISDEYMSPHDIAFWTAMITAQVVLAIIFLTDAAELADVVGGQPLKFRFHPIRSIREHPASRYPFVSIHLAASREPPELVIASLNSLAALDYPNYEVIVVDNNTPDPALWEPLAQRCRELGPRFRFFTLGTWPGFKAGALNYALKETDPRAEVVGVLDADYVVEPDWLSATLPYFENPEVAVVQAPQEHRDWEWNDFRRMENDEYSGFFRIGMVQRNEHNAIIQHGTMSLIRVATLRELGGWGEWCICEDAEFGLRVIAAGQRAIYIDHAFGRGLVPDTYESYSRQRFRWAYGAMRILRHHARLLFGLSGNLSLAQRYQFVKGWLPWIGDALHMIFTFSALLWSTVLIADPLHTDFPEPIFIYPALALVFLRIFGTLWSYAVRVRIGAKRTLFAMIAGGSLTHKIAKAVFQGLLTRGKPFYRTPKMENAAPIWKSLASVREEIALALTLCGASGGILAVFGWVNDQAVLWAVALLIQAFPYFAALVAAILGGLYQAAGASLKPVRSGIGPA